jgi:hypothetical protein
MRELTKPAKRETRRRRNFTGHTAGALKTQKNSIGHQFRIRAGTAIRAELRDAR